MTKYTDAQPVAGKGIPRLRRGRQQRVVCGPSCACAARSCTRPRAFLSPRALHLQQRRLGLVALIAFDLVDASGREFSLVMEDRGSGGCLIMSSMLMGH